MMWSCARVALLLVVWTATASCSKSPGAEMVSTHLPLPPKTASTGRAAHVVIISIDGLRPDALTTAPCRNLLALIRRGAHSPEAETIDRSLTLPSHSSMLTGLNGRHGITWNEDPGGATTHPTVFSIARQAGLSTAAMFSKPKFHYLLPPGSAHWIYGPRRSGPTTPAPATDCASPEGTKPESSPPPPAKREVSGQVEVVVSSPTASSAVSVAEAFSAEWSKHQYQLTFIHFGDPDGAGHGYGWMSPEYLSAVRNADQAVGIVIESIQKAGCADTTAIIVTSDHGGSGKVHFHPEIHRKAEDVTIPWICTGPGVPAGLTIDRTILTQDTAPTVLAFLGLKAPAGIDGRVVEELFK